MSSKNKGGREARKPPQHDKKHKGQAPAPRTALDAIRPTTPSVHGKH